MSASPSLGESRRHCRRIARREARNFYYGMCLLPRSKREAMQAVYAFLRRSDDLSDSPLQPGTPQAFAHWRRALEEVYEGKVDRDPILPAFRSAVERFRIPREPFEELIRGTEMDLTVSRYDRFEDLYLYCYRVGGVVGLIALRILEAEGPEAATRAEALGVAFQLTNILRDVKEDAARGRIYIPQEDLRRFGVREEEMLRGSGGERLRALLEFEADRAERYYEKGLPLVGLVPSSGRASLAALVRLYRGLLCKIRRRGFDVWGPPVRLSFPEKLLLAGGAWLSSGRA